MRSSKGNVILSRAIKDSILRYKSRHDEVSGQSLHEYLHSKHWQIRQCDVRRWIKTHSWITDGDFRRQPRKGDERSSARTRGLKRELSPEDSTQEVERKTSPKQKRATAPLNWNTPITKQIGAIKKGRLDPLPRFQSLVHQNEGGAEDSLLPQPSSFIEISASAIPTPDQRPDLQPSSAALPNAAESQMLVNPGNSGFQMTLQLSKPLIHARNANEGLRGRKCLWGSQKMVVGHFTRERNGEIAPLSTINNDLQEEMEPAAAPPLQLVRFNDPRDAPASSHPAHASFPSQSAHAPASSQPTEVNMRGEDGGLIPALGPYGEIGDTLTEYGEILNQIRNVRMFMDSREDLRGSVYALEPACRAMSRALTRIVFPRALVQERRHERLAHYANQVKIERPDDDVSQEED